MRRIGPFFLFLCLPSAALAQGAAPELFGVREVVLDYVRFPSAKTADNCGLSREQIASDLLKAFKDTTVPAIPVAEAKPPSLGIARIELIPEISTYADENLTCVSWISLSAEGRSNAIISPVNTLRSITAVYWRQHTIASSSQSSHAQVIDGVMQKMAAQFAEQYRIDQPSDQTK